MAAAIRAFVAIDVPPAVERALAVAQRELVDTGARARWSPAAGYHLTLRFLGDLDPAAVEAMTAALRSALAGSAPFELAYRGLGSFGRKGAPRVVWAGVGDGEPELRALAGAVDRAAGALGLFPDPKGFTPHVTLGRIERATPALVAEVAAHPERPFGTQRVDEVVFYRSEQTGQGRYGVLARVALRAPSEELGARQEQAPARGR